MIQIIPRPNKIRTRVRPEDLRKHRPILKYTKHPQQGVAAQKPAPILRKEKPRLPNLPQRIVARQLPKQPVVVQPKVPVVASKPTPKPSPSPRSSPIAVKRDVQRIKSQRIPKSPVARSFNDNRISSLKNIGVGRILVMIAAGPSVSEIDLSVLNDHPLIDVMCINQPYMPLWPTKFWAFCDHTQYQRNTAIWDQYKGIVINSHNVRARKTNQILIKNKPGQGFSLDPVSGYHIGRSSTYAAMQIANYMNFRRVFLFGVDMAEVNGVLHYYGQNPHVTNEIRKQRFEAEAKHYWWAATHLPAETREKFVFCSSYNPWPFLEHFGKLDHKSAIQDIFNYEEKLKN